MPGDERAKSVTIEAIATFTLRHALPWVGKIRCDSLTWKTIKLAVAIGALALLLLHGPL